MPDVHPESYNQNEVNSFVRALESAEQYSMEYIHKMTKEGLFYVDSGIATISAGESFYSYMENPSGENYGIISFEPQFEATGTLELHGYFNADVDTGTFTQQTVKNLDSGTFDQFTGNVWSGPSTAVTINDTNNEFYTALVGTGKKSGGTSGGNLIAIIQPGDSLLIELRNNGSLSGNSDVTVAFQAPYHEQVEEFTL